MTTRQVPLPFLLVESLPYDCLLLASPTQTVVASASSGQVLHQIAHATALQAPRCSSVLSLSASATASSSSTGQVSTNSSGGSVDCLVALVTDDKDLLVYKVAGLQQAQVKVEQIYKLGLPKRAIKIAWECDDGNADDVRVIVGDRHGDVRSFSIPLNAEAEEREAKRRKTSQNGASADKEEDEEIDKAHPPHLGHASMLTSFVLTSFTESSPEKPARFIITSDRDEHIRISRWGRRRAGHLALRYLLGSKGAIGGLCVIEHEMLRTLQAKMEGAGAAKVECTQPLLISTDSSRIRVWSLHRDSEISASKPDCVLDVDLLDAVSPYMKVDAKMERLRERTFAKGVSMSKKKQNETVVFDEHIGKTRDSESKEGDIVIMQRLSVMESKGEVYLTFVVDGASGLFTIPLSTLLTSSADPSTYLQVLDVGTPLLGHSFSSPSESDDRLVWMTCDVRHPEGEGYDERGLKLARWSSAEGRWEEVESGYGAIEKQKEHLQSVGTPHLAYSLLLYDALCLYPKQEFEMVSNVHDAVAPNGLVRGGLSNFDKVGSFKNDTSTNSERATISRAKLREDMLRRIEQSLGAESSASSS